MTTNGGAPPKAGMNETIRLFTRRTVDSTNGRGWEKGVAYEIREDGHSRYIIDSNGVVDREGHYINPFKGAEGWELFWLLPDGTELEALP